MCIIIYIFATYNISSSADLSVIGICFDDPESTTRVLGNNIIMDEIEGFPRASFIIRIELKY